MIEKLHEWAYGPRKARRIPVDDGSPRYAEFMAHRLIRLAKTRERALRYLPEIIAIGRRLYDRGGLDRMLYVLFLIGATRPDLEHSIKKMWATYPDGW
ncbi:hypothetical protein GCM10011583_70230 [Streptomyces camponoticapitis]|uniref:Uncharacterized protein n=1 Tax=Streptomyces camponoticapitis TaxID=1616125 RepID=A0ABQ2EYV2_9ACTN|nr:hypothetical protein [Streptomyces camponoticapitis]GGK28185.1 hypothetical protein GCM10011583_70230 [Streptomyces camponoticapitis]